MNERKKIIRKQKKHQYTLMKDVNVKCLENPTNILAICNVGLANGLTEDCVINYFNKFGRITRIMLIPGKSYGFFSYDNTESANTAFTNCNGVIEIAQNNKPVYLSFIESFPKEIITKYWNKFPPGLLLIENFITNEEEEKLLKLPLFNNNENQMKHRQVKHFGFEFKYDTNNVDKNDPLEDKIPEDCDFLWNRLNLLPLSCVVRNFVPDQLTVNYYKPGQGIPSHIDTHSAFEDPIISLSLNSDIIMEFKNQLEYNVLLPRRSLAIMSGESRYAWTHGITPRKFDVIQTKLNGYTSVERQDRISFTFRKILRNDFCQCNFKEYCDKHFDSSALKESNVASELEKMYVYDVYENIADHFSETRHKPWPQVLNFVNSLEAGGVLVDVGCGNGKYFGYNKNIVEIGCDRSFGLMSICKSRGFEAIVANCLNIPLKDSFADGAISIAVIHHLANQERRLYALSEIVRILKVGGKALIYVWAKNQSKDNKNSSYLKQKKDQNKITPDVSKQLLPIHENRTQFQHNDIFVPWKLKPGNKNCTVPPTTLLRFYHVFEENELISLCKQLKNVEIERSYYDQGNWCVIFKRIS